MFVRLHRLKPLEICDLLRGDDAPDFVVRHRIARPSHKQETTLRKFLFMGVGVGIVGLIVNVALAEKASCDFGKCMSVCEIDNSQQYRCAGMCSKIISLCAEIMLDGIASGSVAAGSCSDVPASAGLASEPKDRLGDSGLLVGGTHVRELK